MLTGLGIHADPVVCDHQLQYSTAQTRCYLYATITINRGLLGGRKHFRGTFVDPIAAGDHAAVERLLEKERSLGADLQFTDIIDEVAGVYPRIMRDGDVDAGAWSCGMVAGLIHDIPTCRELVDRIMRDAEQLIRDRLESFLQA